MITTGFSFDVPETMALLALLGLTLIALVSVASLVGVFGPDLQRQRASRRAAQQSIAAEPELVAQSGA